MTLNATQAAAIDSYTSLGGSTDTLTLFDTGTYNFVGKFASGMETITLGANGMYDIALAQSTATALDATAVTTQSNTLTINSATTGTLNITGLQANLTATNAAAALNITLVDATSDAVTVAAGTGNLSFSGGNAGDTVTVTGLNGASQTLSSTAASKFDITAGAGAQTITMGAGNDTIVGGAGADVINVGAGTDTIKMTGTGQSFAGASITSGITALTGIDKVTGMAAGDIVDLSGILNTFTGGAGNTIAAATDTTVSLVRGNFVDATSVFTADATGTATLVVYDADGAGLGTALEAILLVGTAGVTGNVAAGVLTLA